MCVSVIIHWGDVWTVLPHWVWGFGRGRSDVLHHKIRQAQFSEMVGLQTQKQTQWLWFRHIVKVLICHSFRQTQSETQPHQQTQSPVILLLSMLLQLVNFLLVINDSFYDGCTVFQINQCSQIAITNCTDQTWCSLFLCWNRTSYKITSEMYMIWIRDHALIFVKLSVCAEMFSSNVSRSVCFTRKQEQ